MHSRTLLLTSRDTWSGVDILMCQRSSLDGWVHCCGWWVDVRQWIWERDWFTVLFFHKITLQISIELGPVFKQAATNRLMLLNQVWTPDLESRGWDSLSPGDDASEKSVETQKVHLYVSQWAELHPLWVCVCRRWKGCTLASGAN